MKTISCLAVMVLAVVAWADQPSHQPQPQQAQPKQVEPPIAGRQPIALGVTVEETVMIAKGWSVKKHLQGKPVFNDKGERVGSIDDVIIGADKAAHFAVVGTGGFVGLDRHDVAIPFTQLDMSGNRITLPGATKDALKALPPFQYMK